MDIVERLRKNADGLENGPYTSIKEARESMRAAAAEIEHLRAFGNQLTEEQLRHAVTVIPARNMVTLPLPHCGPPEE